MLPPPTIENSGGANIGANPKIERRKMKYTIKQAKKEILTFRELAYGDIWRHLGHLDVYMKIHPAEIDNHEPKRESLGLSDGFLRWTNSDAEVERAKNSVVFEF